MSPNVIVQKFCKNGQFRNSLGQNYAEILSLHKISTSGIRWNYGIFTLCKISLILHNFKFMH